MPEEHGVPSPSPGQGASCGFLEPLWPSGVQCSPRDSPGQLDTHLAARTSVPQVVPKGPVWSQACWPHGHPRGQTALQLVPKKHGFMWQNPPAHKVWRKVGGGSWKEVGRKGLSRYAVCRVGSCEKKADLLSQSRVLSWWGLWEQAKPQGMGNPEAKGRWTWLSDVKAICLGEHSRDLSTGVSGPSRGLQRRPIPPKAAKRTSPLGPLPAALL